MTLREAAMRSHPDFPWLDGRDRKGVESLMQRLGWLDVGETVASCEPEGFGNMNLTLRIRTSSRDLILKQARPWVEKFDQIPAPWNRAQREIAFYRVVSAYSELANQMPELIASDPDSRTLLLEFLDGDGDYADLYARDNANPLSPKEIEAAAHFLAGLHTASLGADPEPFAAPEMRELNYAHIFEIPLAATTDDGNEGTDFDLDSLEPGLARAAASLRGDANYLAKVDEMGRLYLEQGSCLLHGDYFLGSWLRSRVGLRVIDPEFCFYGHPEIDIGCAIAHFSLAGLSLPVSQAFLADYRERASAISLRDAVIGRFAGVEVMRRLIGVAQLPIPIEPRGTSKPSGFRCSLLERSRAATLEGDFEKLFG